MKKLASYLMQILHKWHVPILTIAALFGIAMCCFSAYAQSGAGSIKGTVTDPTGAVIPGAAVHVVNQATGVAIDTKTNNVGFYEVPELFTGTYTVTVSVSGMKTTTQTIELLVAQDAVINLSLTAGAVTQQVTVSANISQLQTTDNGSITTTLENAMINELPMNGRNLITLVNQVTPGLESCPESSSCANGINSASAMDWEVDGATISNRQYGGVHSGSQQMVDPDAIQQVTVQDEASGAQYAAPATVILSTKSGTNHLHGSAFWTTRNNDFGIARSRSNPSNYVAPELIRNEVGASVGGPVIIPHLYNGRDKTFFFFEYERYSLAQAPFQNDIVPTAAMRNGDFSGLVNSSNILQELYQPATTGTANTAACPEPASTGTATPANAFCRTPYPGNPNVAGSMYNYIGTANEAPLAAVLNAMTPLPSNSNDPLVESNLSGQDRALTVEPQITWRLDHEFSENNRAYLRYTQNLTSDLSAHNDPTNESYTLQATLPNGDVIPYAAANIDNSPLDVYAVALGYTHVFSPTFYSETVLSQSWFDLFDFTGINPNLDYEQMMGTPNNFGEKGFPEFADIFDPMAANTGVGLNTTTYDVDENLSKTLGKHQLLFGGRYRFEHMGSRPNEYADEMQFGDYATALLNPSTYSSSAASAYSNTGQLNADEFIGAAYEYTVNLEPPYQAVHDMELDAYIQDNWRVRSNLTVNLGLRWEAHPAMWEGQGAKLSFDLKHDAIVTTAPTATLIAEGLTTQAIITNDEDDDVTFETPSQAGLPPQLAYNYNLNFMPRVGLAWQPFGKWGTVLRGGFGEYTYPTPLAEGYQSVNRNNPFTEGYSENYTSSQYTPHSNYMMLSGPNSSPSFSYSTTTPSSGNGWPIMGTNTTNAVNSTSVTAITPGISIDSMDPHNAPEIAEEANFTIEQPIKWGSVLRVSYLYTHGSKLVNFFYYNDHPSEYSWEIQQAAETPSSSAVGPYNSSTGEGPFDNLSYGDGSYQVQKTGWSNYNALQAAYQKLYHSGSAWQIIYVWEKNLRAGGDYGGQTGDAFDPYSTYVNTYEGTYVGAGANEVTVGPADAVSSLPIAPNLPPSPPTGTPIWGYYKALNRWENYMVDTNPPPQHLQFNALLDLPFGRGKRWLGGVNKPLNEVIGGWQVAGSGNFQNNHFQITSTNWGPTAASGAPGNSLHVYKHGIPITDCRSGICLKSYEWFNGYIAPTAISGNTCAGTSTSVVNGLPGSWVPYQTPLDTSCTATSHDTYYGDNDVAMSNVGVGSANGVVQENGTVISYGIVPAENDNGSSESAIDVTNPFAHTVLTGPMNWTVNASLFKVFPITERVYLRLNVDAFNFFNNQGLPTPSSSDGTVCVSPGALGCSSQNTPRQIQLSLRISF